MIKVFLSLFAICIVSLALWWVLPLFVPPVVAAIVTFLFPMGSIALLSQYVD
jgi:hypothetical protein